MMQYLTCSELHATTVINYDYAYNNMFMSKIYVCMYLGNSFAKVKAIQEFTTFFNQDLSLTATLNQ